MKDAIIKLLKVKSLVTLIVVVVFAWLCVTGQIGADLFLPVLTMIISFYFGVQSTKESNDKEGE